jgi:hypothetical protein
MDACNLAWCNGDVIAFNNLRSNDRVNGLPDAGKLKLKRSAIIPIDSGKPTWPTSVAILFSQMPTAMPAPTFS